MTTEKENESAKKPLSLAGRGKLELKRPPEASSVRQSFSHGRTKTVTVEVKRKRTVGPETTKPEPVGELVGHLDRSARRAREQPFLDRSIDRRPVGC